MGLDVKKNLRSQDKSHQFELGGRRNWTSNGWAGIGRMMGDFLRLCGGDFEKTLYAEVKDKNITAPSLVPSQKKLLSSAFRKDFRRRTFFLKKVDRG